MIAYNSTWLNNLFIQQQANSACYESCLTKEEVENIKIKYPVNFYSPHFFIRVGLFVLTIVILSFCFGILALLFMNSIEHTIGGLTIFFALLAYAALEYMVQSKQHYRSGVDDALLWVAATALYIGIYIAIDPGPVAASVIALGISLYCSLRFTDTGMSLLAFISLLGIFFFICAESGGIYKAIAPFIIMGVSALVYLFTGKIQAVKDWQYYRDCLKAIEIASLLNFYFAGNYYVVRELSNSMFHLGLRENESIPFGWLFWIFTVIIPVLYLFRGIQKKDPVMLRVGLLLIAVIVFTVRYYYFVAPIEIIMTTGGIALISISYALIRSLKAPRYGFTYEEMRSVNTVDKLQVESLVLAETFGGQQSPADAGRFGGGGFGGGGASGEY